VRLAILTNVFVDRHIQIIRYKISLPQKIEWEHLRVCAESSAADADVTRCVLGTLDL